MAKDKVLTGAAGVHYVAFQLSARGYVVGLTPPGAQLFDLLVANPRTSKVIDIQVKTMRDALTDTKKWGRYWCWRVGKKLAEAHSNEMFFLALVDLREESPDTPDMPKQPDVYILRFAELKDNLGEEDAWCILYEKPEPGWEVKSASEYRNRWDRIQKALA